MTKKRFTFGYIDGVKLLMDNRKFVPDNMALKLLNELHEENQRLKLENDGLRYALKNIKQIDVEIDIGDLND